MKKILSSVLGVCFAVSMSSSAAAQPAATVQADDGARLAEASAIINIMFPPATRQDMMDKMLTDLTGPMRQSLPMNGITDPGLKALFKEYLDNILDAERPLIARHLPAITGAMAIAYAHQFSLAELKDIHAFALSPSGHDYFSHVMTVVGDPVVKKVTVEMMVDGQSALKPVVASFKDKVVAYIKAHPDAAAQLQSLAQGKAQGNSKPAH